MDENTAEKRPRELNCGLLKEALPAWFCLAAQVAQRHDTLET